MWVLTVLKNGNVYLDGKFVKCDVLFDEKIVEIGQNLAGENEIDLDGKFVTPGFVDIHIHGRGGFNSTDDCESLSKEIAKCGVTSFLPTTLTMSYDDTLTFKKEKVKNILNKAQVDFKEVIMHPTINNKHYRNKITLKVFNNKIGYYKKERYGVCYESFSYWC